MRIYFLILSAWIVVNMQLQIGVCDSFEKKLLTDKLSNYSVFERPVADHRLPLIVYIKFTLQQLIDVDERNQILTTNAWLDLKWNNYLWKWNRSDYGNISKTRMPFENIWKPDILLYNSADIKFDATTHTHIVVNHKGDCLYVPPGIFKSTCKIDVSNFPFDEQQCTLKFGIWSYNGNQIDLQFQKGGGADTTEYTQNGEWKLIKLLATRNSHKYECCSEKFVDVTFTLIIRRRTIFYIINLILPCILNSILTLLTFFLPAAAAEKITLAITVLLAQIVFMLLVTETMPPTSDAIPLISKYFACSLVAVCASVGGTVLVLSFYYTSPEIDGRMSPRMRKFLLATAPKWLHMAPYSPKVWKSGKSWELNSKNKINIKRSSQQSCRNTKSSFRPSSASLQNRNGSVPLESEIISENNIPSTKKTTEQLRNGVVGTLFPVIIENKTKTKQDLDQATSLSTTSTERRFEDIYEKYEKRKDAYLTIDSASLSEGSRRSGSHGTCSCQACRRRIKPYSGRKNTETILFQQVLREVQKLNQKLEQQNLRSEILQEWHYASRVVDKILLWIFSTFVIIATLATLFAVPNIAEAFNIK